MLDFRAVAGGMKGPRLLHCGCICGRDEASEIRCRPSPGERTAPSASAAGAAEGYREPAAQIASLAGINFYLLFCWREGDFLEKILF